MTMDVDAAQAAYAQALRDVAQQVRLLVLSMSECEQAARSLGLAGVMVRDFPLVLSRALAAQLDQWQRTDSGRALLSLPPLPTREQEAADIARHDLEAAQERLKQARAIEPLTSSMVDDRQRRIQDAAAAVVQARKRVAELEGGPRDGFRSWLREFAADVRGILANPPSVARPDIGELMQREREADARRAAAEDPLSALLAAELQEG